MRKKFFEGLMFTLALVFWGWVGYVFMFAPRAPTDPPKRDLSPEARALNLCSPLVALDGNMELSIYSSPYFLREVLSGIGQPGIGQPGIRAGIRGGQADAGTFASARLSQTHLG